MAGQFLMYSTPLRSTNTGFPHTLILMHITYANAHLTLHAHLQHSLQVAAWYQVIKYILHVETSMKTKPLRTLQNVLCVNGSLYFSGFFSLCQAGFVDWFSSADCLFYLSAPFPSPSLFRVPLSPLAQSGLSGL